eukprot:jgi/Mesvir1/1267/Mv09555-RA.1
MPKVSSSSSLKRKSIQEAIETPSEDGAFNKPTTPEAFDNLWKMLEDAVERKIKDDFRYIAIRRELNYLLHVNTRMTDEEKQLKKKKLVEERENLRAKAKEANRLIECMRKAMR